MIRIMRHEFLGELRRLLVLQMLDSPTLRWDRSEVMGRTGFGAVWQLADRNQHEVPEIVGLSRFLAGAVHTELGRTQPGLLPAADETVPQVFPVRMTGGRQDPPHQHPHRDGIDGRRPIATTIYYPEVRGVEGGDLVVLDRHGRTEARICPAADMLVVLDGDTLHAVEPVFVGLRTSIVVNFYGTC